MLKKLIKKRQFTFFICFFFFFYKTSLLLTSEQVVIILPQFNGSLIELSGALPGLWTQPGPHVLHTLFIIGI